MTTSQDCRLGDRVRRIDELLFEGKKKEAYKLFWQWIHDPKIISSFKDFEYFLDEVHFYEGG